MYSFAFWIEKQCAISYVLCNFCETKGKKYGNLDWDIFVNCMLLNRSIHDMGFHKGIAKCIYFIDAEKKTSSTEFLLSGTK